jgi:hypothetical protein
MSTSLDQFQELLQRRKTPCLQLEGALWARYGRMIVPEGPLHQDYRLDAAQARHLLQSLGGLMVRWTHGLGRTETGDEGMYAVTCSKAPGIANLPHSVRREVRRGLELCEVRRMSPAEMAELGYACYKAAHTRYQSVNVEVMDEATFKRNMAAVEGLEEVVHLWGVFVEGHLAGIATVYLYDGGEVHLSMAKFDPAYLKKHTSAVLSHVHTEHYLGQPGITRVVSGLRSLLHATQANDYQVRKFRFEITPLRSEVAYRPFLGPLIKGSYPFRSWLGRLDPRLGALYEQERLTRMS